MKRQATESEKTFAIHSTNNKKKTLYPDIKNGTNQDRKPSGRRYTLYTIFICQVQLNKAEKNEQRLLNVLHKSYNT